MASDAETIVRGPEGCRDPYPRYHHLRAAAPVHRSHTLDAWLLTRYEDCWTALPDPRFGTPEMEQRVGPEWHRLPALAGREHSILTSETPKWQYVHGITDETLAVSA